MFGKRPTPEETPVVKTELPETVDLEVPVAEQESAGMAGFTKDKAPEAPKPVAPPVAPAPKPVEVPKKPAEQYQIVETSISPSEGLYVYKIVTNKYLGELGGVYEA